MPVPVIVYAICEMAITAGVWAWRGYQAYETAQTVREAAEMAKSIAKSKEEIAKKFKDIIESMSSEIDAKSSTFALVDSGGKSTVSRKGNENQVWKEYIERKLPFRPAISAVCKLALASPITVPRRIRRKIPGEAVETTFQMLLKQTTASIMFETIDSMLGWRCPLKAEPNYNRASKAAYLGTPPTRPRRFNQVFPFWPRPRGSLAPDLVIVEYRQKPFEVENVFAAVEVKFPEDWIKRDQIEAYVQLMTPKTGADRASIGKKRVALLRVPEDCTDSLRGNPGRDDPKQNKSSGKTGRR